MRARDEKVRGRSFFRERHHRTESKVDERGDLEAPLVYLYGDDGEQRSRGRVDEDEPDAAQQHLLPRRRECQPDYPQKRRQVALVRPRESTGCERGVQQADPEDDETVAVGSADAIRNEDERADEEESDADEERARTLARD